MDSFQAPDVYRELCKPFETLEEANKAFESFQEELYELRKKHRVRDLVFIAQIGVKYDDGDEGSPIVLGMFGNEEKMEAMTAYALGRASAERQERVTRMTESGLKQAIKAPKRKK